MVWSRSSPGRHLTESGEGALTHVVWVHSRGLRDLLTGQTFTKARLHTPGAASQTLECATDADYITLQVPYLDLWGIIELL